MKKAFAMLLILALGFSCMAAQAEGSRLESAGYASPEEAVLAYLDAMNQGDVGEMLSTFALETFAEHVNGELYNRRLGAFSPVSYSGVPVTDEYSRSLLVNARYGEMARALMSQYIQLGAALDGMTKALKEPEELQEIEKGFARSPMQNLAGHVEFVGWVNPVNLTGGNIVLPPNRINIALQTAYTGAEDIAEMAAHIRVNGVDGLQLMQCAKYDGKWFNLGYGGNTGSVMGLNMNDQVLKLVTTMEDLQLSAAMLMNNYPEESKAWDACKSSSLAGTRWLLQELNVPGVTVGSGAEAPADSEVQAEMRFYGVGGAWIGIRAGDAVRQMLSMPWEDAHLGFAWSEENGGIQTQLVKAMRKTDLALNLEGFAVSRPAEDRIVIRMGEIEAVFVKQ